VLRAVAFSISNSANLPLMEGWVMTPMARVQLLDRPLNVLDDDATRHRGHRGRPRVRVFH
jgi:hypothetical protein